MPNILLVASEITQLQLHLPSPPALLTVGTVQALMCGINPHVQIQLVTGDGTVFYLSRLSPYGFTFSFTPAPVGGTCGGFLCDEVSNCWLCV
jgi:hypothetical protein